MSLVKSSKSVPLALGLTLGLALAAGALSFAATPASAAPARNMLPAAGLPNDLVQDVQWRRRGHYRYRGGYYRRDRGGEIAAGVLGGLALGAMVGAATAAPPPPAYYAPGYAADSDWIAYCSSKYRSFDPRTGTYLGYDGLRHPCQ
jgi:hypothetical protein